MLWVIFMIFGFMFNFMSRVASTRSTTVGSGFDVHVGINLLNGEALSLLRWLVCARQDRVLVVAMGDAATSLHVLNCVDMGTVMAIIALMGALAVNIIFT